MIPGNQEIHGFQQHSEICFYEVILYSIIVRTDDYKFNQRNDFMGSTNYQEHVFQFDNIILNKFSTLLNSNRRKSFFSCYVNGTLSVKLNHLLHSQSSKRTSRISKFWRNLKLRNTNLCRMKTTLNELRRKYLAIRKSFTIHFVKNQFTYITRRRI